MYHFSPSTSGFYLAEIHGARLLNLPDPAWIRPLIKLTLQPGEKYDGIDGPIVNESADPLELVDVPDATAMHPTVEVPNPYCQVPLDAVEITEAEHAELLAGQAAGKSIVFDDRGLPRLMDPLPPTSEQLNTQMWELIKRERDRRTQEGGYQVGAHWFHSDTFSRTQQMGLVMLGASLPSDVEWKTMGGAKVLMTPALAQQIFATAAASDIAIFAAAESHRAAVMASADPAAYDFSGGWPPAFGE